MKQTTTRLAPQRRPGLQTLKSAWQRLSMILLMMLLTTMTAWALQYTADDVVITLNQDSWVYTGDKICPTVKGVSIGGEPYDVVYLSSSGMTVNYWNNTYVSSETNSPSVCVTLPDCGEVPAELRGVEVSKTFTITKAPLTVTAGSASKVYDGTPLTCNSYTVDGLVINDQGYNHSATVTGSQTDVGESANVPSTFAFVSSGRESNYDITYVPGTLTVTPNPDDWEETATDEYTIKTARGWEVFCDCLDDNDTYNRFSGKTVKLGADITVTRMAGSSQHDFCGTFDGQGYTLTFNYGTDATPATAEYVAPFCYVSNTKANPGDANDSPAAFLNLRVCGDIYTSAKYAAGLIAREWGTVSITNCRSSINIHSSVSGDGTHGGFVSGINSGTLTITGSLFDGKLLGASTIKCAGFVGWNSSSVTITNSLYAPADGETWVSSEGSATFARGDNVPTITNSYYTTAFGTAQGKQRRSITTDDENVTVANAGNATEYSVSGITSYGTGIKYGSNLYAGSGDQVSLTLAHQDREGYEFQSYTASAGTLSGDANPYTLTMPDADVTVTATWAKVYNLGNCWHVPAAAEPTGTYMRNPIHPYASLDVTIYNGNQASEYEGGNPGNPGDQSGGTIYYRAAGATAWQAVPMECDTEIENNKYWRGTIPANEFAVGTPVEYVIKVTYNEHDDTYLGLAAEGETASTAFGTMAEAEAHPFSFKYLTPNTVDYIDENGQTQTVTATLLTDDLLNSDLGIDGATTWYVVNEDITHSGKVTCRGNVNLILADGKKLTTSNPDGDAIYGANGTLTIYGQTLDTGTLEVTTTGYNCIDHNGNVAICGGTVNATSYSTAINVSGSVTISGGTVNISQALGTGIIGTSGVTISGGTVTTSSNRMIGIASNGTVTINGGTVNANSQTGIRGNGGVTINGGQVTATATNGGQGIISLGNITLGWTNATDFIKASSYQVNGSGTVNIADGQAFLTDDATPVQIKGTVSELSLIAGKKLTPDLSYAPEITVSYVKADGTTDTHQAKVLTGNETTLDAGWYVVISNINYTGTVSLAGDVTIILADGKTMSVSGGNKGINADDGSLTIYGQTLGTGTLNATATNGIGIYTDGIVTINGGTVNATGTSEVGIRGIDGVTINGGTVTTTGIMADGNVTISGGKFTATDDPGICSNDGNVILGWTSPTDFIRADSYYAHGTGKSVTIAPGYAFHNGSEVLRGTIDESDYATKLEGMTLVPYGMTLAAKEATVNDETNYWTTYYCGDAGFSIDAEENACAYTATVSGETITLHRLGKVIPAGTAVIIVGEDASIGMTVSTAPAKLSPDNHLHGLDIATPLATVLSTYSADAILMLSNKNGNFGFHDVALTNIPARKAFLAIDDPDPSKARQFTMVFDENTTAINEHESHKSHELSGAWYTLDGRRIANGQKPTAKGLYIVNGKKVVIK